MTHSEIVDKVLALMNELKEPEEFTLLGEETVNLEDYIERTIPVALQQLQRSVPHSAINRRTLSGDQVAVERRADGSGALLLPADYAALRLLLLQGWGRPCLQSHPYGSPAHLAQLNAHTRAGVSAPVCIEGRNDHGARILECYSLAPSDGGDGEAEAPAVELFQYEALYDAATGLAGGDADMQQALCYLCAALVFGIFENVQAAAAMERQAQLLAMPQGGDGATERRGGAL